jgi:hypothetical protein
MCWMTTVRYPEATPPWRAYQLCAAIRFLPQFRTEATGNIQRAVDRSSLYCSNFYLLTDSSPGARGSLAVKALCYKSEGRGFKTR